MLAEREGILSIPSVVLYVDGRPVAQAVGLHGKAALVDALGLDRLQTTRRRDAA